jgi:hypothetical protein
MASISGKSTEIYAPDTERQGQKITGNNDGALQGVSYSGREKKDGGRYGTRTCGLRREKTAATGSKPVETQGLTTPDSERCTVGCTENQKPAEIAAEIPVAGAGVETHREPAEKPGAGALLESLKALPKAERAALLADLLGDD